MSDISFQRAIAVDEVAVGTMAEVPIANLSIVICRTPGGWYALDNVCSHANAKMHEGRLRGNRLICPLHGASFDCRTGAVLAGPAQRPLKVYPVRCVGDDVEIGVEGTGR